MAVTRCTACDCPLTKEEERESKCPACGAPLDGIKSAEKPGREGRGDEFSEKPRRREERDDTFEERPRRREERDDDYDDRPRRKERRDDWDDARSGPKQRHGCLTAWLILMIVVNSLSAAASPFLVETIQNNTNPNYPDWMGWATAALGALIVVCAIALFNWKKWGFYGVVVIAIAGVGLNIYAGFNIVQSLSGLIGIAILYGVLQIGGRKSGWAQMD